MADRAETDRGFGYWLIENRDYAGDPPYRVSIQESSLATERKLWLGREGAGRMHLSEQAAREVRDALDAWLGEGEQG